MSSPSFSLRDSRASETRTHVNTGADPGFFLGGGTLVSCSVYFNTNKPHSFFFCRIPVVLENRRSSQGGVRTPCTLPLDPPLKHHPTRESRDAAGREKNEGLQTKPKLSCFSLLAASHLSLVPVIFTRSRFARSTIPEGGKTTTSSPRRFSLGKRGMLIVYNFYSSTGSCCSENSKSAGRGTPVIRVEVCSVLSGTHTIYKKLKQQHTRFPWVGGREHSIV